MYTMLHRPVFEVGQGGGHSPTEIWSEPEDFIFNKFDECILYISPFDFVF